MWLKYSENCARGCICMQCALQGLCVYWKLLWNCQREEHIKTTAKIKMQAENKLFLHDKLIKYMFPMNWIS